MKRPIHILFAVFFSLTAAAADRAPDIKTLMKPEDFTASGLDTLSDEQREYLSNWLANYRKGVVAGPAPPKTPEQKAKEREIQIAANVLPTFQGWSGKTVFRLDNGQAWQQRNSGGGKFRYRGDSSEVVISKNMFGFWEMKHPESGRQVGVKRLK